MKTMARKPRRIEDTARDLLRRIVATGLADRFAFADVAPPRERTFSYVAFERLLHAGLIDRVPVSCGVWHYRVTEDGREAAQGAMRRPCSDSHGRG
jgi:hypothetical protein